MSPSFGRASRFIPVVAVLLGVGLTAVAVVAAPAPEILRADDIRPDRGDVPGSPHVTGPASPIHGFYNGDCEISFWQGPAEMTFDFAKNDVWDRRYLVGNKRVITLEDVRRACFGDAQATRYLSGPNGPHGQDLGLPNAPQALYLAYDFPCPKPVGQLALLCPDLAGPDTWSAGTAAGDALAVHARRGPAQATVSAFLCRTRNLFALRADYSGLTAPLQVQLYRHRDTTPQGTSIPGLAHFAGDTGYDYSQDAGNGPLPEPTAGADGKLFWVRQSFPADPTFPRGFESVMMACLVGAPYSTRAQDRGTGAGVKATLHPLTGQTRGEVVGWLKELRIAAERVNNAQSGSLAQATVAGPRAQFTLLVAVATTRDAADPLAAARKLLTEAREQGYDAELLESMTATRRQLRDWRLSRVMHYNATSCTWADATPWHGDYHWNEVNCTSDIVAGGSEEIEQRLRLCEELLPALQRNAREVFGCRGAAFSLVHYPIRAQRVVYSNVVWEWGLENTGLMLQPFWQVFQYAQDLDFLRQRAYPMLREGARFYADYVKKGEDGFYHVIPTVSQEHRGFTPGWRMNRDSVGALSFVKYTLRACIQGSEILGLDAAERERWREIVAHLAPYPTLQTPGGPVFCDVRDAPELLEYNITANLVMTLWGEDISLDSPPAELQMARRSWEAIPHKERSMRPGYLDQIATFLGIPRGVDLSPQGRVLSWPGRIHLYAGVPVSTPVNDQFRGLRAVGAFEVAATHVGTEVRKVRITSRAGKTCRVANPWGSAPVKVITLPSREAVAHRMEGDTVVFDTRPGFTYALLSGPELAQADQRFLPREKVLGRWRFARQEGGLIPDESGLIPDESGGGHPASLVGDAVLRPAPGDAGLALSGNQAFARVERTRDFDFAADESFSLEARVKLPPGPPPPMIPLVCSMSEKQYCFMLTEGQAYLYLSSPRGDVFCFVRGESILTDGRWHQVRAVRDVSDGMLRVFVDGRLEGEAQDTTTGDFSADAPLTVGAYLWGEHSRYARGLIADVVVKSLGKLTAK